MAKRITKQFLGGRIVTTLIADDFEFNGLAAPADPSTILELVNTNGNIVTVLGYYFWTGSVWQVFTTNAFGGQFPSSTLASCGIPVLSAPNGTVAANGTITLGTALPLVYQDAFVYLPAGAIVGGAAGLYYAQFSSTTVGVIFAAGYANPAVSPFLPYDVGSGALAVGSGVAYTQAIATNIPLVSIPVKGNALGANGAIRVSCLVSNNNSAGAKNLGVLFAGNISFNLGVTATLAGNAICQIRNRGVTNSQVINGSSLGGAGLGIGAVANSQLAIDTTIDQTLTIISNLATATDYLILEGLTVELMPAS